MKTAQEKLQRHVEKQREYQQRAIARQREQQADPEWRQAQYEKQRKRQSRYIERAKNKPCARGLKGRTLLVIAGAAMYAPYGPFFAIIPEMLPRNVAGGAMALINSMGALGSFFGSWFVGYLNGATGSPSASYIFMGVALFASVWLTLIVKPANNQQLPVGARHA